MPWRASRAVGAHIGAGGGHALGAVGAHAREHVDEEIVVVEEIAEVRREIEDGAAADEVGADDSLGDGQGHAGAAELGGVHVAVDPGGGADAIRDCGRSVSSQRSRPSGLLPMDATRTKAGKALAQAWTVGELVVGEVVRGSRRRGLRGGS